ncbi:hypothetical protein [Cellulomonas hominis]
MTSATAWPDATRAARFELVRARSARPIRWIILIAFVAHVIATVAVAAYLAYDPTVTTPYPTLDVVTLVMTGPAIVPLVAALVGVLVAGADYRHGAAELVFLICPRRRAVLAAKVGIAALLAAVVAAAGSLVAAAALWLLYAPVRHEAISVAAVGAIAGLQIFKVVLWATVGTLVTMGVRSQALAGVTIVAFSAIVEPMARSAVLLSADGWWSDLPKLLPFTVLNGVTGSGSGAGGPVFGAAALPQGWSMIVSLGWICVLSLLAVRSLRRPRSSAHPSRGMHARRATT